MRRLTVPGTARFLTFSCYRRLRLFANDRIKNRFVDSLRTVLSGYNASSPAWVVMPEHVHLVVFMAASEKIPALLSSLKRPFAREVLNRWRELDAPILPRLRDRSGDLHFWQAGGGYDRNVIGKELIEKIRYIHRNPVSRRLVAESTSWNWSSAAAYADSAADPLLPIAFELVPAHQDDLY